MTLVLLGGFMWIMFRRDYRQAHDATCFRNKGERITE